MNSFIKRVRTWKIPRILLNRYVFTLFVFAVWMTFFDQNNLFIQLDRYGNLQDARQKIYFYKEETARTHAELYDLMTNESTLEKFAREKYYMKKPDEDVFVIVEE